VGAIVLLNGRLRRKLKGKNDLVNRMLMNWQLL
jgi:hypothetical protein